jgi:hypothetical protein
MKPRLLRGAVEIGLWSGNDFELVQEEGSKREEASQDSGAARKEEGEAAARKAPPEIRSLGLGRVGLVATRQATRENSELDH